VVDERPEQRWILDTATGLLSDESGEVEVDVMILGTAEDLIAMIRDDINVGVLLRSGRIRHVTADESLGHDEVIRTVAGLVRAFRRSLTRAGQVTPTCPEASGVALALAAGPQDASLARASEIDFEPNQR
jgi:hypothetical protein